MRQQLGNRQQLGLLLPAQMTDRCPINHFTRSYVTTHFRGQWYDIDITKMGITLTCKLQQHKCSHDTTSHTRQTDRQTHAVTETNWIYNLFHAICYTCSYGADNSEHGELNCCSRTHSFVCCNLNIWNCLLDNVDNSRPKWSNCVWRITCELNDFCPQYLARCFILAHSSFCSSDRCDLE